MKYYEPTAVHEFVQNHLEKGFELTVISDGVLLEWGKAILTKQGMKTCVITEAALNEWSSAYKVRRYNVTPQKYAVAA